MKRLAARAALIGVWLMTASGVLVAQIPDSAKAPPPRASQSAVPVYTDNADAEQTRQRLHELLRQVPPAVYEVLKADPSLIDRPDYLTPYPALAGFFQQHPEISRSPSFFLGEFRYVAPRGGDRSFELIQIMLASLGVALGVTTFVGVLVWLVRTALDHRRWLRLTRVQTEVHTKLLDRLGTNEELLAYIQSPAGRRFLESAPIAVELEAPPPTPSVPVTRILWSLQAGFVLMSLGGGFWLVQTRATELAEGFWVMGVLIGALGIGFVLSAVLAFVISARLGLVNPRRTEQQV
jgi:hypothetical protein